MTFSEFINKLTQEQVYDWWDNHVPTIDIKKAETDHWKYRIEKDGRKFSFKAAMSDLAEHSALSLNKFSSNDTYRYLFCEKFDFEIAEDLVFDSTEKNDFITFYNKYIKNTGAFQEFIRYAYSVFSNSKINLYKIRVAIADRNRATIVIGMREVLSYYEKEGKSRISFMISESFYESIKEQFVEYDIESFVGEDQMKLSKYEISSWDEIPNSLLE